MPLSATCWRVSSAGGTAGALTATFGHGHFGDFAGGGWSGFAGVSASAAAAHRGQPFDGLVFAVIGVGGGAAQQHARGPTRTERR